MSVFLAGTLVRWCDQLVEQSKAAKSKWVRGLEARKVSTHHCKAEFCLELVGDLFSMGSAVVVAALAYLTARVHASPLDFAAVGPIALDGSV